MSGRRPGLQWALLLLALAGCGKPSRSVPAGGRVMLDGQPIAGAAVLFSPVAGGVPGRATTAEDGSFTLSTFDIGDGALVGVHRVGISKMDVTGFVATEDGLSGKLDGRQIQVRALIPERYMNPATSGLEAEVKRGSGNRFEFGLTAE
jgi:hypothetical protein